MCAGVRAKKQTTGNYSYPGIEHKSCTKLQRQRKQKRHYHLHRRGDRSLDHPVPGSYFRTLLRSCCCCCAGTVGTAAGKDAEAGTERVVSFPWARS